MIIRNTRHGLSRCPGLFHPLRLAHSNPPLSRNFHASKPNRIVDEALQLSSAAFHFVHDTSGLSWGISIPVTAALCQFAFSPLYYTIEKNDKRRDQAGHLLIAWRDIYRAQVVQKLAGTGPRDPRDAVKAEAEVKARLKVKEKEIQQEVGYRGRWLNWTALAYIPIWLSNVGALSRLCGVTEESVGRAILPDSSGIVFDPAFTREGFLWFTDLTIADPTWILPLVAWGFLLTSVSQISRRRKSKPGLLQKFINLLAVAFGPWLIISEVYSGVVLAIMASTSVSILRRLVLDTIFRGTQSITPADSKLAALKPRPVAKQMPRRRRMG